MRSSIIRALVVLPALLLCGVEGAEPRSSKIVLETPGTVRPRDLVQVTPTVAGRIVKLHVEPGTAVKAGDVLAELDETKYKLEFEHARAKVDLAKARYEEVKAGRVEGGKVLDSERFAVAEAELKLAEVELRLAQYNLDNTQIRASMNGTVLRKRVEVGAVVDPKGDSGPVSGLYDLADLRHLEVAIAVPEVALDRVFRGQPCRIYHEASKTTYQGEVSRLQPILESETRTLPLRVQIELPEKDDQLRPGSFVRVQFLAKE